MARVTMREAAERLGVSQDTIKRRLRRGELQGVQEPRPQGYVWMVELDDAAGPAVAEPIPSEPAPSAGEVRRLEEMVSLLREQLANRERDIRELHVLLEQAQRALPPPQRTPEQTVETVEYTPRQVQEQAPEVAPEQLHGSEVQSAGSAGVDGDTTDASRTWLSSPAPLQGANQEDEAHSRPTTRPWWRFW